MTRNVTTGILVAFIAAAIVAILVLIFLMTNRDASTHTYPTATASLVSQSGDAMGTVTFHQQDDVVVVALDVSGFAPGGHAVAVHAVGSCSPDFTASGDHFGVEPSRAGFVHPNWKRDPVHGEHGGDLPNFYAHRDGSARADFVTDGFTLLTGHDHSLFDADGAAIVIYEKPQIYGAVEENTGSRVACGVITVN
ncbi:MAG: superoxide dismutase family protein [Chloroflexota bacterium]|nr:superoxide dismutase family protein [Chloroflexota bacterium]MDE2961429.1 superoxide dismutase family protein [Chloroflexota bacterium]